VQIPRCRATVSEEIAPGHWSFFSGKARGKNWDCVGRAPSPANLSPLLASQETGANCQHQPLSRLKEE
jgi:hypothetical protein